MRKPSSRDGHSPELEELRRHLVEAIPIIGNEIGSMFGRALPRVSARQRAALERDLDQFIRAMAPNIGKLEELKERPAVDLERMVTLDQFVSGLLKSARLKLRPSEDPWDLFLQLAAKRALPPRAKWTKSAAYERVQQALWDFLVHLYAHAAPAQIFDAINEWAGTDDARRYLHSVRLLQTAARRFRVEPPKRLTDRLLVNLQQEYTLSAAIFEARLRVLVFLAQTIEEHHRSWNSLRSERLHNLLAIASRQKSLDAVVSSIDRTVRNALVHGSPVIDMASGTCRFEDLNRSVTWTLPQFFEQTRGLTLSVLAMERLEPVQQFIHAQAVVHYLRYLRQGIQG